MTSFIQEPSISFRPSVFPEDLSSIFYIQNRCQTSFLKDASQTTSNYAPGAAYDAESIHLTDLLLHLSTRFINNVEPRNQTGVSKFILLGITEDSELQPFIFSLFLIMYLITVLGNLLIVLAVCSDSYLHTPMYLFLSNLSFNDICISTTTIPKMLVNILTQNQSITYTGCLNQIFFVVAFGSFENFILAVMAYDRYVAICHPLRYTVIMNTCFCGLIILFSLLISIVNSLLHSLMVLHVSFCTNLEIPQFFCELTQVLKLACSSILINNILIYLVSFIFAGIPLCGIMFSYTQIFSSVLKMSSASGKYKAFSTCGSHLSVISLFYGTAFGVYLSSSFTHSPKKTAVASVMYLVFPQMMNPFIYSLRNKDVKVSLRKVLGRIPSL
ncbi:PREDICTED: olfactory receptor 7G2-like [Chrysochloris asiatica]|uniref:Olfactory receptor n=1 Tax=Chrysochloris asiatica TaxID=185453 RepID=A0A9B0U8N7_CHRAS|nr:PREDICTED: olfactory receptor 7G2-like [Chrysochloris asiatica]